MFIAFVFGTAAGWNLRIILPIMKDKIVKSALAKPRANSNLMPLIGSSESESSSVSTNSEDRETPPARVSQQLNQEDWRSSIVNETEVLVVRDSPASGSSLQNDTYFGGHGPDVQNALVSALLAFTPAGVNRGTGTTVQDIVSLERGRLHRWPADIRSHDYPDYQNALLDVPNTSRYDPLASQDRTVEHEIDLSSLWRHLPLRTGDLREDGEIWRADTRRDDGVSASVGICTNPGCSRHVNGDWQTCCSYCGSSYSHSASCNQRNHLPQPPPRQRPRMAHADDFPTTVKFSATSTCYHFHERCSHYRQADRILRKCVVCKNGAFHR